MVAAAASNRNGNPTDARWPEGLDTRTICLTVDVEWVHDAVLADMRRLFDERGLPATFFCTHAGIDVGAHERGLHPNYRRNGDQMRELRAQHGDAITTLDEADIYRHVLSMTKAFAPEAKGVRSHSLYYDSSLMPIYREFGLQYDSSYQIPLVEELRPFWKEYDVIELPIYFTDHFELKTGVCGLDIARLRIDQPGLKVINLHPNMLFLNCADDAQYQACKPFYRDVERLKAVRHRGRGIRDFVTDLLDAIVCRKIPAKTLGDVNAQWRGLHQSGLASDAGTEDHGAGHNAVSGRRSCRNCAFEGAVRTTPTHGGHI
jgi:peptidoglycan/xylan/chitin deacetylase (PgdA/CDA1 family)